MKIKNISLGWITTANLTGAKKFFVETLGLTVAQDSTDHGWLELQSDDDKFRLGIAQREEGLAIQPGQNAVITFTVANIEAVKAELEAKQIKVHEIVEVPGHVKMAFIQDNDGNYFQLVEMLN